MGREDSPALLYTDQIKCLTGGIVYFKGQVQTWNGVSYCVQVTQDKTRQNPRGRLVRAILSSVLSQPTNKHAHKPTASLRWSLCCQWQSLGAVSRTGSALLGLQDLGPASPAAQSVPGVSLVLHCLVHSSPKPSSLTHKGYFFVLIFFLAEQLSFDHWH